MTALRLLVAALLLGTPPVHAEEATVALNFQDVELPVLARFVSEVTGRNLIVDDAVKGSVTVISPTRITPEEAWVVFQSVLQVNGFATVPSGAFTKIVPTRDAREGALPSLGGAGAPDQLVTSVLSLEHASVDAVAPTLQPLVSKDGLLTPYPPTNRLIVVDAASNVRRLTTLLRDLDKPSTAASVDSVGLRFASAEKLASRLAATFGPDGLQVVPEPRTNRLLLSGDPGLVARGRALAESLDTPQPRGSTRVRVYQLRYARAESMVRVLSRILGLPAPPEPPRQPRGSGIVRHERERMDALQYQEPGVRAAANTDIEPEPEPVSIGTAPGPAVTLEAPVRITADPDTNALVVSASLEDWKTLKEVIAELDVRRRQVFVEAIILEATVDKTRELGIEFRGTTSLDGGIGLGQVNLGRLGPAAVDPTGLSGLVLAAASNETITLPNGLEVPAHLALLRALETQTDLDILSAPNLVTTDNEEAEIIVGRNIPFVASRATDATNLSNLFTTIERYDVGITLRLLPRITADDYVHLQIFEEVSDIDRSALLQELVGDPEQDLGPITTVRSASTMIGARDGQTVIIGGLLADTIRHDERRVPFLADVPVLGNLFKSRDDRRVKTNLIVFLTPHVVDADWQMADLGKEQRRRMPADVRRNPLMNEPSWEGPSR
jgi:general secretion pathway protein D